MISASHWADGGQDKLVPFAKPAIKHRLIQMRTKLSPLVSAILSDYAYTDLSAYLLDYSHEGFTMLEISTQSGFPYSTSFLTQIKTEIFAPLGSKEKVTIFRRTEEF